jgi:hypothetical protein
VNDACHDLILQSASIRNAEHSTQLHSTYVPIPFFRIWML